MNRKQKMLMAIGIIINRAGKEYSKKTHLSIEAGGEQIGFYYSDSIYFHIVFKGYEVNINGDISCGDLDSVVGFSFDKWIDDLFGLLNIKGTMTLYMGGKKYRLIEATS